MLTKSNKVIFTKSVLKKGGLISLCIGTAFLAANCSFFSSKSGKNGSSSEKARLTDTIKVKVGITDAIKRLGLGLNAANLSLVDYTLSVAGCGTTSSYDHSYFNQTFENQPFSGTSASLDFSLPSDDADCYLNLSSITIDAGLSPQAVYNISSDQSAASRSGTLVFNLQSGAGAPSKLSISSSVSGWSNSAAPTTGATMSYTLKGVVKSSSVIGDITSTINYTQVDMPIEIYLADNLLQPVVDTTNGRYDLSLVCTGSLSGTTGCGDVVVGSSPNYSICTIPASGSNAVSEANIGQNALTYCHTDSVSASAVATSYQLSGGSGVSFNSSSKIVKVTSVPLLTTIGSSFLDHIGSNAQASVWVLLYIDAGGSKQAVKYWKVTF